jgi:16S rRNA (cytidine1402-2'-O)-methyltransferase
MSTLYIVATPIGNLEDITLRALRILKEVDLVLCEDTRVTKKLLRHHEIDTQTMSYHMHSKLSKEQKIIELLEEGKDVALVSDAGTPAISDPGAILVKHIREQCPEVSIESVPGPSAVTAAFSIAGLPVSDFIFFGFLPHKKGRQTLFEEIAEISRTAVFYESPHRIVKALTSLKEHCPNKKVTLVRELTKMYEDVLQGSAEEILATLEEFPEKLRGEMVVIVSEQK